MTTRDYSTLNSKKTATQDIYTDIDITFERHPITEDITVKKDLEAVKRSLKNILLTNHYERPFKPNFGSNLRNRLFDIRDGTIGSRTGNMIVESIRRLEPRIDNLEIRFSDSDIDTNQLNVTIFFSVQNVSEQQQMSFKVSRVR